ncbi:hypothetical protein CALVIDRAFT_326876 [Calocera viscosa TUFC12733]|uniref:Uncharacterized protein n=1 Tax=Calocera viscosa (strain TUFC12733) TaxID=1330018 RepID=A0A167QV92_CALVF|nr:hypothetical protein CALVIDRAFT_326876 [Calocera viscosa TUFC12733]
MAFILQHSSSLSSPASFPLTPSTSLVQKKMQLNILAIALAFAATTALAVPVVPPPGCFWDTSLGEWVCPGGPIITAAAPTVSPHPHGAEPRGVGPVCPDGICPITCTGPFGC